MEVAELVAAEPVRRQRRQVPSAPAEWNGKRMRGFRTGIDCYIRIDLYLKQTGAVRLLHLSFALSSAVLSIQIVFFFCQSKCDFVEPYPTSVAETGQVTRWTQRPRLSAAPWTVRRRRPGHGWDAARARGRTLRASIPRSV